MDTASYRSFLVRLWREPPDGGPWRGEIESIQSGQVAPVASMDEVFEVIHEAVGLLQPAPPPDLKQIID